MPWTRNPWVAAPMPWRPGPHPISSTVPPGGTSSFRKRKKVALRSTQAWTISGVRSQTPRCLKTSIQSSPSVRASVNATSLFAPFVRCYPSGSGSKSTRRRSRVAVSSEVVIGVTSCSTRRSSITTVSRAAVIVVMRNGTFDPAV